MWEKSNPAPRLRSLELKWIEDGGKQVLLMRDPSGIAPHAATVLDWVALLLSFCDGQRSLAAIRAAFELRSGLAISQSQVENIFQQLDEALFLEGPRYQAARQGQPDSYRKAPSRRMSHADGIYPRTPEELFSYFDTFRSNGAGPIPTGTVRGVISPHIDYQRGGPIYAQTWDRAARAIQDAEVVIIFGTDHAGSAGSLTLTRQNYATPLGVLPTDRDIVDAVAEAIGPEAAFAEELHHAGEHSIELAAVWLHALRKGPPPRLVPVLCGSFYPFTEGDDDPATYKRFEQALQALRVATTGRGVLAVAAADLAHVGPAFGDPKPLGIDEKGKLTEADGRLLAAIRAGDAAGFFAQLRETRDRNRICGLPPIYLTLRFLGNARGEVVGYDQCPADSEGGSFVSIAGVLLE